MLQMRWVGQLSVRQELLENSKNYGLFMEEKKAFAIAWLIFLVIDALVWSVLYLLGFVDFGEAVSLFFICILADRAGEWMRKRMEGRQWEPTPVIPGGWSLITCCRLVASEALGSCHAARRRGIQHMQIRRYEDAAGRALFGEIMQCGLRVVPCFY